MQVLVIPKIINVLLALVVLVSLSFSQFQQASPKVEILSRQNDFTYNIRIDGKDAQLILELSEERKDQDRDIIKKSLPSGTVKIVFKDNKSKGITLVYDRNMGNGEISEVDQKYLDKVFDAIEKFQQRSNSIDEKIRGFCKTLRKK